ncbi:hypothetical protein SAMN05216267_1006108 [Actinacidiphila rubida]|uniref:Integral membrane protein n=1 Tax=Actinacidiphila rubida TaxID=310780 RepID=A0A1H8H853_9ACTN|nr:hypothetical protein [Actinacidiphila rubida]SEN52209.1 hypothetical protein SAMN05216267_1006108 [Actinacidiphila rubida]
MWWEAAFYAVIGLAAALAASHLLPRRLPRSPLVLATGPGGGLAGGLVAHTIFGGGHLEATFPAALAVAAAVLSLLARPDTRTGWGLVED